MTRKLGITSNPEVKHFDKLRIKLKTNINTKYLNENQFFNLSANKLNTKGANINPENQKKWDAEAIIQSNCKIANTHKHASTIPNSQVRKTTRKENTIAENTERMALYLLKFSPLEIWFAFKKANNFDWNAGFDK